MSEILVTADKSFNICLYTVKETAEILGVTTRTIENYLRDGRLKGQKIGGKWRVTKQNLENFVNGKPQE